MRTYYIYLLTSRDNTVLYTGVTNDLNRRIMEHRSGTFKGFTQKYHVHKLVYFEQYGDINEAIAREKQIKSWPRARKDELVNSMNPEWKELCES